MAAAGVGWREDISRGRVPDAIEAIKLLVAKGGNINEAIDVLAEEVVLPRLQEGDVVALLNAGGYGSAMASNHCMRGAFTEHLLD